MSHGPMSGGSSASNRLTKFGGPSRAQAGKFGFGMNIGKGGKNRAGSSSSGGGGNFGITYGGGKSGMKVGGDNNKIQMMGGSYGGHGGSFNFRFGNGGGRVGDGIPQNNGNANGMNGGYNDGVDDNEYSETIEDSHQRMENIGGFTHNGASMIDQDTDRVDGDHSEMVNNGHLDAGNTGIFTTHNAGSNDVSRNDNAIHTVGQNNGTIDQSSDGENGEQGKMVGNSDQGAGNTGIFTQNVGQSDGIHNDGMTDQDSDKVDGEHDEMVNNGHQHAGNTGTLTHDAGHNAGSETGAENIAGNSKKVGSSEARLSNGTIVEEGIGISSTGFHNGNSEMKGKSNTEELLNNPIETEKGVTSTGGNNVENGGVMNHDDMGPKPDDNGNEKSMNPKNGDGSFHDDYTGSQPQGMMNADQHDNNPNRQRPDDGNNYGASSHPGPPGVWVLKKKNNISTHDGGNDRSVGTKHENRSGTHGKNGIWKWSRKMKISKDRVIEKGNRNLELKEDRTLYSDNYSYEQNFTFLFVLYRQM